MTEKTETLIADLKAYAGKCEAHVYVPAEMLRVTADALEAATEQYECAVPGHAGCKRVMVDGEPWFDHLPAERDAALAGIERVRALHQAREDGWCSACAETNDRTGEFQDFPCPTIQALDGAPEPEWEYGTGHTADPGVGAPEPNRRAAELRTAAWNRSTRTQTGVVVRHRKAGPWLPVEGGKP